LERDAIAELVPRRYDERRSLSDAVLEAAGQYSPSHGGSALAGACNSGKTLYGRRPPLTDETRTQNLQPHKVFGSAALARSRRGF